MSGGSSLDFIQSIDGGNDLSLEATALSENFAHVRHQRTSLVVLGEDVKELVRGRQSHVAGEPSEKTTSNLTRTPLLRCSLISHRCDFFPEENN